MNLQEYINQENPVKLAPYSVQVKAEDLRINGNVLNNKGLKMEHVTLLHFGFNYILLSESGSLWTMDENSQPKEQSVFYLINQ